MGTDALAASGAGLYRDAIAALEALDLDRADALLRQCLETDCQLADATYFLAVIALQRGSEAECLEFLAWSEECGAVAPDFFKVLGRVIEALGPEKGEAARRFLQRHRKIPWQLVGKLGGEIPQDRVEPWYFSRQVTHFFPGKQEEFEDIQGVIERYILPGFLPATPPFTAKSALLTMGSCFAKELRNYLEEKSRNSHWLFVPPGLNNTFALRNFIEWCITGDQTTDAYWYDEASEGGARKWHPQAEQQAYRRIFESVDGLVLTVGLAEVWYDTQTGGVFWRGVPKSLYDETKHKCRMSTVEENVANIRRILSCIRSLRPGLPIVLTLSPIPLRATFEPMSCFVADCISKSTLRVAIDEVMRGRPEGVSYWPSFEIVRWLGGHIPMGCSARMATRGISTARP